MRRRDKEESDSRHHQSSGCVSVMVVLHQAGPHWCPSPPVYSLCPFFVQGLSPLICDESSFKGRFWSEHRGWPLKPP